MNKSIAFLKKLLFGSTILLLVARTTSSFGLASPPLRSVALACPATGRPCSRPRRRMVLPESNDEEPELVIEIEDLSLSQIAELIEVTFIQACMQLAQGYVDLLKLFIVSVKSAYQRSPSLPRIVDQVNACPVQTAGRPLVAEEIQLRTTWMYAVALMLDHLEYPKQTRREEEEEELNGLGEGTMANQIQKSYGPIVTPLVELHSSGGTLKTPDFVKEYESVLPESIRDDDVQLAIVSQTIKVMWYTLIVLEEERFANASDDGSPMTRPQIPRGSGIN